MQTFKISGEKCRTKMHVIQKAQLLSKDASLTPTYIKSKNHSCNLMHVHHIISDL